MTLKVILATANLFKSKRQTYGDRQRQTDRQSSFVMRNLHVRMCIPAFLGRGGQKLDKLGGVTPRCSRNPWCGGESAEGVSSILPRRWSMQLSPENLFESEMKLRNHAIWWHLNRWKFVTLFGKLWGNLAPCSASYSPSVYQICTFYDFLTWIRGKHRINEQTDK